MKNIIIIICSVFVLTDLQAQTKSAFIQRAQTWSINASISETRLIPLFSVSGIDNSITKVYHPKYTIGAERNWKVKKGTRKYIGTELSYHNNYLIDRSVNLNINVGIEYQVYKGSYFGFGLGAGFAKAKRADLVYELKGGVWEPRTYPGKWQYNRFLGRANAELGYRFQRIPIDVFAGANVELMYKYLGSDVPINLQQSPIKIGARWHLQKLN
jgi:hypothetical protein